jgi:uncharacterized protein
MGHKVKIRVGLKSGKTEKMSFTVDEGKTVRLNGEIPGMAVFAALVGDPQVTVCRLSIEKGALIVSASSQGSDLLFNNHSCRESKVKVGDKLGFDNGWIEFLECPEWVEEEAATKFVSLETSDKTAMFVNSDRTKVMSPEELPTQAYREEAQVETPSRSQKTQKDDATGIIMAAGTPDSVHEKIHDQVHDQVNEAQDQSSHVHDHVTSRIERNTGAAAAVAEFIAFYKSKQFWKHFAVSFAMICFFGEVASLIAFGSKYDFSPIPTPYSGLMISAFFAALSGGLYFGNRYWYTRANFQEYFRSFAWFSTLLIPFSLSFSFPKSVIVFASLLLAASWIGIFSVRYFNRIPRFVPVSVGSWIFVLLLGFHWGAHIEWAPVIHTNVDATRDVASETPVAEAPVQQPEQQILNVAPPAPAANTIAENTAHLANEANQLALDPMAQEQFFEAVKAGNLARVQSFVDRHVIDPVFTLDHGSTALHYAAAQGDLRIVKYLVSKKVNIDAQDAGGTTALMWASYKHHPKVVEYLISRKANLAVRREGGDRALEIARGVDDKDIVAMLKDAMKARHLANIRSRH